MSEHMSVVCKLCGHTVWITLEHGGRRAKCPKCEGVIEIPKTDTSIRLRTDRELTREARAKAGRPSDSDPDMDAKRAPPRHSGTARMRKAAPRKPEPRKPWGLILGIGAGVVIVIVIILALASKKAPTETAAPPPPAAPVPKEKPPVKRDPNEVARSEIKDRVDNYVRVFNEANLPVLATYYTADAATVTKAFGILGMDDKLTYENYKLATVTREGDEIRTTISFDRVITNTSTTKWTRQTDVQRLLVWKKPAEAWVITSPPEP